MSQSDPDPFRLNGQPPKKMSKKSKSILFGSAFGALVVVGGLAFASPAASPASDPEDHVPGNATAFASLDTSLSAEQKISFLKFATKAQILGADTDRAAVQDRPMADPVEGFVSGAFPELDYETDVKPWIGDRLAVYTSDTIESDSAKPSILAVVKVTDPDLASEKLTDLGVGYVMVDDYVVVSEDGSALREYTTDMSAEGSLSESKVFNDDMSSLGGNRLVVAWADLSKINPSGLEEVSPVPGNEMPSEGRLIAGADLNETTINLQVSARGLPDTQAPYSDAAVSLAEIASMPADTDAAVSVAGLDKTLSWYWDNMAPQEEKTQYAAVAESYGITLPAGFTKVVGSSSTIGVTIEDLQGEDVSATVKLEDADLEALDKIAVGTELEKFDFTSEDGAVVGTYSTGTSNKPVDKETLDSTPGFGALFSDPEAAAYAYLDLNAVHEVLSATNGAKEPEMTSDLGDVGFTASSAAPGDSDIYVRWHLID